MLWKVIVTKVISFMIEPSKIAMQYKTTHASSEKNNKFIKFEWLKRNPTNKNQKIKFQ